MVVQSQQVPKWASDDLSDQAAGAITAAISKAEAATSGEIVVMVVRRSSVTGHVYPLLLLGLACIYAVLYAALPLPDRHGLEGYWSLVHLAAILLASWLLSLSPGVQRWLTSDADLEQQVMRRAATEFFEAGLNHTAGATGILIFVSLAEHRAVVLTDRGIAARLPPSTWVEMVNRLVVHTRRGDLGLGLTSAVEEAGALAAPLFPRQEADVDELPNRLLFRD